jgi:hypothetical protein
MMDGMMTGLGLVRLLLLLVLSVAAQVSCLFLGGCK